MSLPDTISTGDTSFAAPTNTFDRIQLGEWSLGTATFEQLDRLYVDNTLTRDGINSYVIKRLRNVPLIGSSKEDQPLQAHIVLRVPQNCGITEGNIKLHCGQLFSVLFTPGYLTQILRGGR